MQEKVVKGTLDYILDGLGAIAKGAYSVLKTSISKSLAGSAKTVAKTAAKTLFAGLRAVFRF